MSSDSPPAEVPPEVLAYLSEHPALTLATASRSGVPHAATLVYVNDGPTLYFWTRPESTTARHIEQNPVVSFAVDVYNPDWSKTKGVQGSGESQIVLTPQDISHVVELFQQKYPGLQETRTTNLSFYRVTPTSIVYIDNERSERKPTGPALGADFHREMVYSIFRELPQRAVETVAATLDTVQVGPGEVIVRQGAPADKFFIIADGEVEVVREEAGRAHSVARLGQGQFFGEMAILRDMPRTATVQAVRPTTLLAMDRGVFRGLVAQSLATTEDFDQVIQQRLTELSSLKEG